MAAKIGCVEETPRSAVRQAGQDRGKRAGPTIELREWISDLLVKVPSPPGQQAVKRARYG